MTPERRLMRPMPGNSHETCSLRGVMMAPLCRFAVVLVGPTAFQGVEDDRAQP